MPPQAGETEFQQSLKQNMPLAPMTTLGIGGPARYFADVSRVDELVAGVAWARSQNLPLFVLGGGSNLVVADDGFPGLVLRVALRGIRTRVEAERAVVTAAAGEDWDNLVALCVERNWAGFECLSGIPGRVGATPIQNVGAYGQETSETLVSLEALDLATGELEELSAADCEFGYRSSRFKTRDRGRFIITSVTYRLSIKRKPALRYPELQRYVTSLGAADPTLEQVRDSVLSLRRRKAMVIDALDPDSRSVGSFFVNPIVTREESEHIKQRVDRVVTLGEAMPTFATADDRVKLSAAWLIERAGIHRGWVHGGVGTSTKHALAIVNRGGGTAREVIELKELIQSRVLDAFGVALTPEPVFVGFLR
ncbi:MAG TPA: UDP-N-acetylmuramate dehydrogenase [Blastocatellia bacterium]|nr:UDP-N-acetylmuramate dehydrogenase [Blastocatellia bacterium]